MSGNMTEDELAMDDRVEASYERPTTAAGRALHTANHRPGEPANYHGLCDVEAILAIEAEARAAGGHTSAEHDGCVSEECEVEALVRHLVQQKVEARAAALDEARAAVEAVRAVVPDHGHGGMLPPYLVRSEALAAIDALRGRESEEGA